MDEDNKEIENLESTSYSRKTTVILNDKMIHDYYKDLFIKNLLLLEIVVLVIGSTASTIYITESQILQGIAIEVITLFVVLVIYFINRNNMKIALNSLASREKEFNIEFNEIEMRIFYHKDLKKINYKEMKVVKLPHFYQFRSKNKEDSLIYIVPKTNLTIKEWDELSKYINKKD